MNTLTKNEIRLRIGNDVNVLADWLRHCCSELCQKYIWCVLLWYCGILFYVAKLHMKRNDLIPCHSVQEGLCVGLCRLLFLVDLGWYDHHIWLTSASLSNLFCSLFCRLTLVTYIISIGNKYDLKHLWSNKYLSENPFFHYPFFVRCQMSTALWIRFVKK